MTGDRAYRDDDGYFWFVARADDLIISAGYRIGPFEVESALVEHPDVVEAAAVAAPDADRGSVVKAYVVVRDGASAGPELAARLQEHVKNTTAPYKYPRAIEFVDALPKTVSGKIRRIDLRQRAEARRRLAARQAATLRLAGESFGFACGVATATRRRLRIALLARALRCQRRSGARNVQAGMLGSASGLG